MSFPVLLSLTLLAVLLAIALSWRIRHQIRVLRTTMQERDRALAAEQAAIRTLRLAAIELRSPAMILLGHADHLTQTRPSATEGDLVRQAAAIAGATMRVLNLADEMQDHAVGEPAARVVRPETVALEPMLRDTIVAVEAMLGPSRRQWRLAPDIAGICVRADRRALAQILTRVLGNAAGLSRDQDWIDIRAVGAEDGLAVVIEDEGAGLPPGIDGCASPAAHPASRGVGLGLVLARTLMRAHGGALMVESTSHVGSRVVLTFPVSCLAQGRQVA